MWLWLQQPVIIINIETKNDLIDRKIISNYCILMTDSSFETFFKKKNTKKILFNLLKHEILTFFFIYGSKVSIFGFGTDALPKQAT